MTAYAIQTVMDMHHVSAMATATTTDKAYMIVEFCAFFNCTSLEEIHFENCTEPVDIDVCSSNVPDNLKLIIHDKQFLKFFNKLIPANKHRLQPYSEYLQQKIQNEKLSSIIVSIILLNGIVNILDASLQDVATTIASIVQYLIGKYNVSDADICHIQQLLLKKQEIQDESQL